MPHCWVSSTRLIFIQWLSPEHHLYRQDNFAVLLNRLLHILSSKHTHTHTHKCSMPVGKTSLHCKSCPAHSRISPLVFMSISLGAVSETWRTSRVVMLAGIAITIYGPIKLTVGTARRIIVCNCQGSTRIGACLGLIEGHRLAELRIDTRVSCWIQGAKKLPELPLVLPRIPEGHVNFGNNSK